ncbi:MAG: hypothetical protein E7383_06435 [Ruminococcaceae bacterium]|nr:hypothetical protein [Oscillospiraceae bacterium]
MWTARPFNSDNPNPFGNNPVIKPQEQLGTKSFKCPSCASNIFYQPEVKGMMCRNCGNIYNPSTFEKIGSLGYCKERDYTGDNDISEDDKKRHEIICDSCGATMIADEHMMSTMCPFCGSPTLITGRMTREFKPDYIIPFKIDKKTAENNMYQWLKTRKMTPRGFKTKSRLTKMTPLYVPFWILDCAVNSDLYGVGKRHKNDGTEYHSIFATAKYYVKGVPFDASLKIANKLMEAIEPFDYSEMVKFDNKYLQGFYADKYDQRPTELMDRFLKRMDRISLDTTDTIAAKYDEYDPDPSKTFSWMSELTIKYCLFPVWFMTVESGGNTYQFAVNGQTGEASGQVPTTEAVDKLDALVRFTNSKWRKIPLIGAFIAPAILFVITFSGTNDRFLYAVFLTVCVIELLLIAINIALSVIRSVGERTSRKIHDTVDVVNDFDKAPGMDSYLDTTRGTKLTIDEYNFHFELERAEDKARGGDDGTIYDL